MNTAVRLSENPREDRQRDTPIEMELVACLLCGGDDHRTVLIAADPITKLGGNFRVVECRECGLAFTNPRPKPESIGVFYPADYAPHVERPAATSIRDRLRTRLERAVLRTSYGYLPKASLGTKWQSLIGRFVFRSSRQRQSWIPFLPPGRLLDFGCGAGTFLKEMQSLGWTVQGLDISPDVADRVSHRINAPVHVGTLPHPDLQPESFDTVTMWNSLEHVHQPRETVRAAFELLRSGGQLVIGVQNFASWSARKFREHWHGLELPRHLSQFTPATLKRLLEAEGFTSIVVDQIGRDGWIRHSARRQAAADGGAWRSRLLTRKPFSTWLARWSVLTRQADAIRAIAVKA